MMNGDEVLALISKAESKFKTAGIDLDNGQFEDSISRSYYCAFHSISALLLSKDLSFSSHNQTIGNFNKEFVKTGIFSKDYTEILQSLFEDRQSSDYDALTTFTEENAEESMRIAQKVLHGVKIYLAIE